ncbi:uncharacterized protein PHACADRAFT_254908 [Phanerochaete carnosa HHB-10118-sp]|uniref:Zn(2)-C6 fungal-type domain-containing protein n=1 Tax=Phanerochaete carnosa (strain HHB-10118-sp) TaxID=650164 RepID=K5W085_PHACS|nr:uncharacterized protein PHACADRAFT_254908 [Phanerochaete carnosa HHB-10118-sp]EKM57243.1 hypothetical protein PHACADRAFT_254908 [Phanerochaete carnosa HHB-10118-sp]
MANYIPYSGSYRSYVTPQPEADCDPRLEFARPHGTYGDDGAWLGSASSTAPYQPTISSSSSLAGALDHGSSRSRPPSAEIWPENEVLPMAPLTYSLQELEITHNYAGAGYAQYDVYPCSWDGRDMIVDSYDSPTFVTDVDAMETEHSYLNGQLIPTGTTHSPTPSSIFTQEPAVAPPARLIVPCQSFPFQPTRSYTLEGAVTPVESRKPPRSPNSASPSIPASPSVASVSTIDATETESPRMVPPKSPSVKKETQVVDAAAVLPPASLPPSTLMTKFSTKPPFRHVPPPKPLKAEADAGVNGASTSAPGASGPAAAAGGAAPKKKPAMACLFCRERKICCGPPAPESTDARCKQCIKRDQPCTFPTECRRGQHKRTPRKATIHALAAASFPNDEALADIIVHTGEQSPTQVESATGASQIQAKATTQKVKAAKRGRKTRVRPLEGISKFLDKPIVSSPSLSPRSDT